MVLFGPLFYFMPAASCILQRKFCKMENKNHFSDPETLACCQLNRVFGFDPKAGLRIIEAAGSAATVFSMSYKQKRELMGCEPPAGLDAAGLEQSAKELEDLAAKGCYFLGITADAFPTLLRDCEDPPMGLYIRSNSAPEEIFCERPYIAIVGTRDISHYGIDWCKRLTAALCLSEQMPTIVSGLALGTDIIAHKTALECGCPTIAVMATGVDAVYPKMHVFEADHIAESPGSALISDYPPGTAPVANNFLRRNRIIAGLSEATLLIESRVKGGGMVTANLAYYYNRDVYALPGKADDVRSGGCNKLIAEHKAELVLTPEDMMEKMGLYRRRGKHGLRQKPLNIPQGLFSEEEEAAIQNILKIIRASRGISKADLCVRSRLDISQITGILSFLEAEGYIITDLMGNCSAQNNIQ